MLALGRRLGILLALIQPPRGRHTHIDDRVGFEDPLDIVRERVLGILAEHSCSLGSFVFVIEKVLANFTGDVFALDRKPLPGRHLVEGFELLSRQPIEQGRKIVRTQRLVLGRTHKRIAKRVRRVRPAKRIVLRPGPPRHTTHHARHATREEKPIRSISFPLHHSSLSRTRRDHYRWPALSFFLILPDKSTTRL